MIGTLFPDLLVLYGDPGISVVNPDVIDMFTREPLERVIHEPVIPGAVEPDEVSIKALERLLSDARAGVLVGLCAFMWDPGANEFRRMTTLPPDELMSASSIRYLGMLEIVREDYLDYSDRPEFARDVIGFDHNGEGDEE